MLARPLGLPDNQVFVGRTQDWTERANSAFRVYPRGIERTGAVAENPHKWTSRYGSLILSAYDSGTHEGVNEKGLSAHALYLAGESDYGKRDPRSKASASCSGCSTTWTTTRPWRSRRGAEVVGVSDRTADPAERLPEPGARLALGQVRRLRRDRVHRRQGEDLCTTGASP